MSNSKEKRNIIGGILVVGFLILVLGIELAGLFNIDLSLLGEGFYVGVVIFVFGVILITAYVLYYD